jgi:hypothetical protein
MQEDCFADQIFAILWPDGPQQPLNAVKSHNSHLQHYLIEDSSAFPGYPTWILARKSLCTFRNCK